MTVPENAVGRSPLSQIKLGVNFKKVKQCDQPLLPITVARQIALSVRRLDQAMFLQYVEHGCVFLRNTFNSH